MIFGTDNFIFGGDGKRWQVCICDARFPNRDIGRISVLADKKDNYCLPPELVDIYDVIMENKGQSLGIGKDLTAILTLRNIIEIQNERPAA